MIGMDSWQIEHQYDDAGRRFQTTYPSTNEVTFDYTPRGQLEEVTRGMTTLATFTYDDGGRETTRTYGNSLVTTRTYKTNDNLVAGIAVTGKAALSYSYGYDENKNVETETTGGGMSGYSFEAGYDDENRITSWERDNSDTQEWDLSPVGNWETFTNNSAPEVRTYGDAHELLAIASIPLTYDPKGNLTSDETGIAYAWDRDNLLASVTVPASPTRGVAGTHTYQYDALGRRVAKILNDATDPMDVQTKTTVYVQILKEIPPLKTPGGQVIAEYEKLGGGSFALAREYVHGEYVHGEYVDEPLAMIDRTALGAIGAGSDELLYYHHNRVFNVIGLTDAGGDVAELYTYTPYGDVAVLDPTLSPLGGSDFANRYLFTGRYSRSA